MRAVKCSNGITIIAYVGDGFDGGSGIFIGENRQQPSLEGQWGFPIPHKDLPKVIRLLKWYEKEEMRLEAESGKLWRRTFKDDYPALKATGNPHKIAFYRGHLESHLKGCGCKEKRK